MDSRSGTHRTSAGGTPRRHHSRYGARRIAALLAAGSLASLGLAALASAPALAGGLSHGAACTTPDPGYTNCVVYSGSSALGDDNFTVPSGVGQLYVQMWGAGGGGVPDPASNGGNWYGAGGGGYISGIVNVTPGDLDTVHVGYGGPIGTAGSSGGTGDGCQLLGFGGCGGGGGNGGWGGSAGGDYSAFSDAADTLQLLAGGGGGAASPTPTSAHGINTDAVNASGGGGGLPAGTADSASDAPATDGGPGTQSAGGPAATDSSGCFAAAEAGFGPGGGDGGDGGTTHTDTESGGGGGGGGFWGGGGGSCSSSGDWAAGDGGGGSSYDLGGDVVAATEADASGDSGHDAGLETAAVPGDASNNQYLAGVGVGGGALGEAAGGNGEVVIEWNTDVDLSVTKSAMPVNVQPGHTLTYTVTIQNAGPAQATGVTVNDILPFTNAEDAGFTWHCTASQPGGSPQTSACPGGGATATGTGDISTSDVNVASGGEVVFTVQGLLPADAATTQNTVTVFRPAGEVDPACDPCTAAASADAGTLSVSEVAAPTTYTASGQTITFTDTVTNTSGSAVTLSALTVSNTLAGMSATHCNATTLTQGQSTQCTSTYSTLQSDVDHGSVTNTASAQATDPAADTVSATAAPVTVTAMLQPALTVVKSANPTTYQGAGTVITYTFVVTNTGNQTMTGIHVNDAMAGLTFGACGTTLIPLATETCTATYTTTVGDVVNGSVSNTAYLTGTDPAAGIITSPPSQATVLAAAGSTGGGTAGITLVKSASPASFYKPGQTIQFSFAVENTGLEPLTAIRFNDPLAGLSTITCPLATLEPAVTETCTAQYTTTQDDVDLGSVTNAGTVQATLPDSISVTSLPSTVTVPVATRPEIAVSNTPSAWVFRKAGAVIKYTLSVENTGDVTLHNIRVTNQFLPGLSAIRCPSQILRVGKFMNCYAHYKTTHADVRAGKVVDQVTAFGEPPGSALAQVSDSSMATVLFRQQRN